MSNYNINGFGGVRFSYGLLIATFPYSFGTAIPTPEYDTIQNANSKIFYRFLGQRYSVDVELYSIETDMYKQVLNLKAILNAAMAANSGITIEPGYSADNDNNFSIENMMWESPFNIENLVRKEGLQRIKLKFKAQELVDTMTSFVNAGESTWVDGLGNTIVDGNDNTIIWR